MEKIEVLRFIKALKDYQFSYDDIVYYLVKIVNCNLCPFRRDCIGNEEKISCKDYFDKLVKGVK